MAKLLRAEVETRIRKHEVFINNPGVRDPQSQWAENNNTEKGIATTTHLGGEACIQTIHDLTRCMLIVVVRTQVAHGALRWRYQRGMEKLSVSAPPYPASSGYLR